MSHEKQEAVDLLITARWVVPVAQHASVLDWHSVAIREGRIVAVLPQAIAQARFQPASAVELADHVLIPGLVNAHTHAAMSLLRGLADDLPLMRWLQEAIWPAENRLVDAQFVRDGSLLAAYEMLQGGITTANDMYFHPDAAAEAFDLTGMRAVLGITVLDAPTPYANGPDEYFRKGLAARDRWNGHPRLSFAIAPHSPYTLSDESLLRSASLAAELDCPLHIHIHETQQEIEESLQRHRMRPLARLASLGLLGSNFLGVHAVHLDSQDIALLSRNACSVVHCPTSNMKLASGIAPVPQLLEAGIRVALGTDGAASNNRLDLFSEMNLCALLGKASSLDPCVIPSHAALHMATLGGAEALGMGHLIGSIEAGKCADLCAVDLSSPETQPCYDPVSHLIYAASRHHVSHVWIDGEIRMLKGQNPLHPPVSELLANVRLWHTRAKSPPVV